MSKKTTMMAATALGLVVAWSLPTALMAQEAAPPPPADQDVSNVDEIVVTGSLPAMSRWPINWL